MDDEIAELLKQLNPSVPPHDLGWVKRAARPWIWLRRTVASVSVVGLMAAAPFVYGSLGPSDRLYQPAEPAPSPDRTTAETPEVKACDLPQFRPTYLPWTQDDAGIRPTSTYKGENSSWLGWRGPSTDDQVSLSKNHFKGFENGVSAPPLPDGTTGFLLDHDVIDSPGATPEPPSTWTYRWSINWPLSGSCKSIQMALHVEGLSKHQERIELVKVAESLIEPD